MTDRLHHSQRAAAARAGFSERTARRLDADPRQPSQRKAARGRTVSDPLEAVWGSVLLPILERDPAVQAITLLRHLQMTDPDVFPDDRVRRTLERIKGPQLARAAWARARCDLPADARAGPHGAVGLHRRQRARRDDRGAAAGTPALPFRPGLQRLGTCRRGSGRRKLSGAGREPADRAVDPRWGAARASHRQPLGRLREP